jgi:threonine/homoserine/homoserine lactone efflux protein
VSAIGILGRAIGIGFVIAAPVGPIALLCMQRTLAHGRPRGYVTGVGIATADALYASIAAFGLTALSTLLIGAQPWVRLIGGAALIWLGVRSALLRRRERAQDVAAPTLLGQYASAAGLTLANPQTILTFAAVFAGAGLALSGGGWAGAAATVAGVFVGSLTWWVLVVTMVGALRTLAGERFLIWAGRVSGAAVALLGVVAVLTGVARLIGR